MMKERKMFGIDYATFCQIAVASVLVLIEVGTLYFTVTSQND
jgi:hypothetical protein